MVARFIIKLEEIFCLAGCTSGKGGHLSEATQDRLGHSKGLDSRGRANLPDQRDLSERRAAEPGRGRDSIRPTEIPFKGWRDIFWRIIRSASEDRILSTSGSVAFFALLAAFPAVATVVSLYGLFADAHTIDKHLVLLSGFLPTSGIELLGEQMKRIAGQSSNKLGLAFIAGSAIALWSANAGVVALFDALNLVYKEREKRSLIRLYGTSLLFTLLAITLVALGVAGVVLLPLFLNILGLRTWNEQLIAAGRWPLLLAAVTAALSLIYRYGPSRRVAKWRWVSGSLVAAVLWLTMSMLFSWYVAQFDSYNRVYGSLGAIMGFMTWMWFSVVVVLLGAELNAEMELQTAVDSTTGPPRPLGGRGAIVADTVGEAQN
jgi:membrane protein